MFPHHLLLASMFRPFQLVPASLEPCLPSQPSPRPPEPCFSLQGTTWH